MVATASQSDSVIPTVNNTEGKTYFALIWDVRRHINARSISQQLMTPEEVRNLNWYRIQSLCRTEEAAALTLLGERYNLEAGVFYNPPDVVLQPGDSIIICDLGAEIQVSGIGNVTEEQVNNAEVVFVRYTITG